MEDGPPCSTAYDLLCRTPLGQDPRGVRSRCARTPAPCPDNVGAGRRTAVEQSGCGRRSGPGTSTRCTGFGHPDKCVLPGRTSSTTGFARRGPPGTTTSVTRSTAMMVTSTPSRAPASTSTPSGENIRTGKQPPKTFAWANTSTERAASSSRTRGKTGGAPRSAGDRMARGPLRALYGPVLCCRCGRTAFGGQGATDDADGAGSPLAARDPYRSMPSMTCDAATVGPVDSDCVVFADPKPPANRPAVPHARHHRLRTGHLHPLIGRLRAGRTTAFARSRPAVAGSRVHGSLPEPAEACAHRRLPRPQAHAFRRRVRSRAARRSPALSGPRLPSGGSRRSRAARRRRSHQRRWRN